MYDPYGNVTNFSIQDYAPVDPLSGIPGLGAQQGQPQNAPQQQRQQAVPATRSTSDNGYQQPNPPVPGPSAHRSISTTERPTHSDQLNDKRRQMSTEELRRDIARAPQYIPTPINGTPVNGGNWPPRPNQAAPQQMAPPNNGPSGSVHNLFSQQFGQCVYNIPSLQSGAQSNQQQLQQFQQLRNGPQQPNSNVRGQANKRQPAREKSNKRSKKPANPPPNPVPCNAHVPPVPVRSIQNVPVNAQQANERMILHPIPFQAMHSPELIQIQGNPDIRVFSEGSANYNTHVVVDQFMYTFEAFLHLIDTKKIHTSGFAEPYIRVRLPSTHRLHITQEAFAAAKQRMKSAQQQGSLQAGPVPPGNIAITPAQYNQLASTSAQFHMLPPVPPGISHPARGIPQNVPPGIPPHIPPRVVPPQFSRQHQHLQQQQMMHQQHHQPQQLQQLLHHQQQQQQLQQQQQHTFNTSGLTPDQLRLREMQLHHKRQAEQGQPNPLLHQHHQQQILSNRSQPIMPSQPPPQMKSPRHASQQQPQASSEAVRRAPVQTPTPAASQPEINRSREHPPQQRAPPPPGVRELPRPPVEEPAPFGIGLNIAADESPPPCPYTPPQRSPPSFDPEESIDLKPVITQAEKPKKNKNKIVTITLDDEDVEPRPANTERGLSTEKTLSPSGAASNGTSTNLSNINRNIKNEPTEEYSNRPNKGGRQNGNQLQQPSTVSSCSIKQEATGDTNATSSEPAQAIKNETVTEIWQRLAALENRTADDETRKREREAFERQQADFRKKEEDLERKRRELEQTALDLEKNLRQKILAELAEKEQKEIVQESKVSTSDSQSIDQNSSSRCSSPGSDIIALRRKKQVRIESDEDEDDNAGHSDSSRQNFRPLKTSANERNLRKKKRPLIVDDSDDDMPVRQKKGRGKRRSEDEDKEWEGSSEDKSSDDDDDDDFIIDDDIEYDDSDGGNSMDDFVVQDEEEVIFEDDVFLASLDKEKKKLRSNQESKETPPRRAKELSPKHFATRSKTIESCVNRRLSNETSPSTSAEPMTDDQKKEARRKKILQTREANREKKRMERIAQHNSSGVFFASRKTRHEMSGNEALNASLMDTISQFHTGKKLDSQSAQRKDERKRNPAPLNKRPSTSISEDRDDDGVHVPAKRMAHSNSVPGPSRIRQSPSNSVSFHKRPNQNQILEKRHQEAEERKKKDQEELSKLRLKKFPTNEETNQMRKLENSLKNMQQPRFPSTSTPSSSSNFNRANIKKEIVDSSPVKKAPPPPPLPALLQPSRGSAVMQCRRSALKLFHDTFLDDGKPNAAERAQKQELEVLDYCGSNSVKYRQKTATIIAQLKRECPQGVLAINRNAVSHEQILSGGARDNCTVIKGRKPNIQHRQMTIEQLHTFLAPLKLTDAELEKEAYPLFVNNSNVVRIAETQYTLNKKIFLKSNDMQRTCSRCNKEFRIKPDGTVVREKDICRYHNRGVAKDGKRDTFRKRYNCCNEEFNVAPGCKFSDVHVFDQLFERELTKFVATPPPSSPADPRSIKAYAIDCEMVYTISGPALARFSMVDMQGNKVLDVFIKPPTEVLDPNTEFSGLTMEQIENATDTMKSCHEKLFRLINSETILIGHSLESDLKAMRIVHKSVIDTAILFKSPGDFKIALKNLSAKLLNRTIQGDNEDAIGHDSLEDACTCVDLIYYGLKNPESLVFRKHS